ncbi:GDSL esterase/lipase [Platanthera guangdongensis]|uniref:GDSL esterase/lipase n=1 Tax=Platanthera guangdongensis TaxID=2320717 RepID=A0ABR2MZP0_9ASPA
MDPLYFSGNGEDLIFITLGGNDFGSIWFGVLPLRLEANAAGRRKSPSPSDSNTPFQFHPPDRSATAKPNEAFINNYYLPSFTLRSLQYSLPDYVRYVVYSSLNTRRSSW